MATVVDVRNGRTKEVAEKWYESVRETGYNDAFVYHKLGYARWTLEMC